MQKLLSLLSNTTSSSSTEKVDEDLIFGMSQSVALSLFMIVCVILLIVIVVLCAKNAARFKASKNQAPVIHAVPQNANFTTHEDPAVVAAITAAVAVAIGRPAEGIIIKSLQRTQSNISAWGSNGREEQIHNKLY
jgi:uncharacterized protein YwlG (UPF0340 family)